MAVTCPYCLRENADLALVCNACARDIAIPDTLKTEHRDLLAKRDAARQELSRLTDEIAQLRAKRRG